ncbi:hypothetical protein Tsubulata_004689 [Turnera subulata]|uniref:SHSP domain-containing protein n=1 Tax=Turnera subulata TaxID=218843 RepID=A0A9Q0FPN0_9ROSI|nr:hypothetical protein Tsubulata_004689 [Turnera subulata]
MELELGLRITHTRDDITSFADLRITKDHSGPVFLCRETEAMFILIAHLKGFRRENIDIEISEDGSRITISGMKPVQELVLMGLVMQKKDVELRAFKKTFRIPEGIILDRIKAKFKDEESTLTVIMPKLVKGIRGIGIEEVKEEEVDKGKPDEATQTVADRGIEKGHLDQSTKEVNKMDQAVQEEISRRESEIGQTEEDEVPRKEKYEGEQREERNGYETLQETHHVMEQVAAKRKFEEKAKIEGKEDIRVRLPENSSQPKHQEGTERVVEEKGDRGEAIKREDEGQEVLKSVGDKELHEEPEIADKKEFIEATQEKAEPTISTPSSPETDSMEPNRQAEKKEPTRGEEDQSKKRPVLEDDDRKPENTEADGAHIADPVEDEVVKPETEELPNEEEPETNGHEEEVMEPKPVQGEMQAPNPVVQPTNDELREMKAAVNEVNPDEEAVSDDEHESMEAEAEKQKGAVQEGNETKNSNSNRSKLCPPLVVAGSAILVTIIVFVISWIRAKRR